MYLKIQVFHVSHLALGWANQAPIMVFVYTINLNVSKVWMESGFRTASALALSEKGKAAASVLSVPS
jgi:hypothetical protein